MIRRRADLRRDEILGAAVDVVARNGLARTRMSDVAAELGVSTALLFYHFATKERLLSETFVAAAERDLARLDRVVGTRACATDRLRSILRLYAPAGKAPGWTLDIDAWAEALRTPELQDASRRVNRRWRTAITAVIAEGNETGEFTCPDPVASAERIGAMLDGLAVATQVRRSLPRRRAARWAAEHAAGEVGIPVEKLAGHRSTGREGGGPTLRESRDQDGGRATCRR
ncbi:MAG: hypothetical protein QG608_1850 [Actinomycetota bacterium]|nr:hypothetical protein [Actinomycetota bacterium]